MRRIQVVCASVLVALLLQTSVATTPAAAQAASKTRVYLIRGFANVFSLGLDSIGAKLRARGINATVHNHLESVGLASEAIEACKSGRTTQFILVGHSLGATAVIEMAERMSQGGAQASLVISLDPVSRPTAGGSMHRLINYYISNGVGQPVDRGASFHGVLQNVDLKN